MKRLLALLATVFMVAGLFVGQVFAAEVGAVKIEASTDTLIIGEDSYTITGTIKKLSGRLIAMPVDVALRDVYENVVADTVAIGGKFEITVAADNPLFVESMPYHIESDFSGTDYYLGEDYDFPEVDYRYDVVLDPLPSGLKYGATNKVITGRVVNSKGAGQGSKLVQFPLVENYYDITRSNGYFVLDVETVSKAGEVYIIADGMDTVPVELATIPFDKFSTVSSIIHSAYAEDLNITAILDGVVICPRITLSGVKIEDNYGGVGVVLDGSEMDPGGEYYTKLVIWLNDLETYGFRALSKGTLTVVAESGEWYQWVGTSTIEVKDPEALNLDVDTVDFLGNHVDPTVNEGECYVRIRAFDAQGMNVQEFDWELSGTGYKTETDKGDEKDEIYLDLVNGGKATLTVTGYDDDGKEVGVATYDIEIDGWTYTVTPEGYTVNQKTEVTVVIKNLDGEPVNNAYVWISNGYNDYWCDASDENITDGKYVVKDVVFDRVDREVLLQIRTLEAEPRDMIYDYFPVNGEEVYSLELLTEKITAGVVGPIDLKVTSDGEVVEGLEEFYVDGELFTDVDYDPETEVYTINDAYALTVGKPVYVEVKTDENTRVGKREIAVLAPVVAINPAPLTDLYEERVTITITDPITGEPMKAALALSPVDMWITIDGDLMWTADDGWAPYPYVLAGKEGALESKYEFGLTMVPGDSNEDDKTETSLTVVGIYTEDFPYMEFLPEMEGPDAAPVEVEIPVNRAPAALTLDNTNLYIGYPNRVTFLLKNARAEALKDHIIYQGSTEIGLTDENGGLFYSVTPASTGKVTFSAGTDGEHQGEDQFVIATASAKQDLTGPAITMTLPAETTDANLVVSGTITDDTRVASVYVNNVPVAIIPGTSATFMYTLALHEGANAISVIALDANGNGTPFVGTVNKVTATPKSVSVTIGKVDTNAGLDVPAYVENGRTMVPLAFIVKTLGGTTEWDSVNNTVKIVLGGKTAVVTIGSNLATVNGVPTTLLATVTARNGRTFVGFTDLAAMLGANTAWDQATMTATFTMP